MALIKCHECGGDVSTEASACPKCGAPPAKQATAPATPAKKKDGVGIGGVIGIVVIVLFILAKCGSSDNDKAPEPSKTANKECAKTDLQCNGDNAVVAAGIYCKDKVEQMAKHSVRWTDGTFESKFSRFRWKNAEANVITMIGDKAEFQNGFGAFTPVIYECDLGPDRKTVLDVRVREGRLPK